MTFGIFFYSIFILGGLLRFAYHEDLEKLAYKQFGLKFTKKRAQTLSVISGVILILIGAAGLYIELFI